jgi:hypothetical protein
VGRGGRDKWLEGASNGDFPMYALVTFASMTQALNAVHGLHGKRIQVCDECGKALYMCVYVCTYYI